MSDFDLPNLPSDEDLGLSKEEIAELEKEFGDTGPEMSDAEMAALLGESPPPQATPAAASQSPAQGEPSGGQAADSEPDPKVAKTAAKAAAKQAKADAPFFGFHHPLIEHFHRCCKVRTVIFHPNARRCQKYRNNPFDPQHAF